MLGFALTKLMKQVKMHNATGPRAAYLSMPLSAASVLEFFVC